MQAYIGPCARSCCYTVGDEVIDALSPYMQSTTWYQHHGTQNTLDMWLAGADQLQHHDISPKNIHGPITCTICHPDLYSYRCDHTEYRHMTYGVLTQ